MYETLAKRHLVQGKPLWCTKSLRSRISYENRRPTVPKTVSHRIARRRALGRGPACAIVASARGYRIVSWELGARHNQASPLAIPAARKRNSRPRPQNPAGQAGGSRGRSVEYLFFSPRQGCSPRRVDRSHLTIASLAASEKAPDLFSQRQHASSRAAANRESRTLPTATH